MWNVKHLIFTPRLFFQNVFFYHHLTRVCVCVCAAPITSPPPRISPARYCQELSRTIFDIKCSTVFAQKRRIIIAPLKRPGHSLGEGWGFTSSLSSLFCVLSFVLTCVHRLLRNLENKLKNQKPTRVFFWPTTKICFPILLILCSFLKFKIAPPSHSFLFFFQIWISPLNLDPICGQPFLCKIPTSRKDFLLLLLFLFQLVQFDHPPASCRRGIFENSQPNRPKMDALQSVEPSWKNHFYWQQRKGRQEKKRIFFI